MNGRMFFVNLATGDLERAIDYFTRLGFDWDPRFCDKNAACMIIEEDASYVMLLREEFFRTFTRKDICDSATHTEAMFALSAASRAAVDDFVDRAVELGGRDADSVVDQGFMYSRSFYDPDGHHWEMMWIDVEASVAAREGGASPEGEGSRKGESVQVNARIAPCLWFDDQAEEAARFYIETFPGGRIIGEARYPESSDNSADMPRGSVMTVDFEVANLHFTALNGGPEFQINPSISFFVEVEAPVQADEFFERLADGGEVLMPLDRYPWSERFGWVRDRFGVSWQIMARDDIERGPHLVPCLMFAGPRHGRAEGALELYARVFPEGAVTSIERYSGADGPEGTVKHGRVSVDGQEIAAMDAHGEHGFTFNEGLSLQVMCADQDEIDHYREALTAHGGEEGPRGWLKDRYGVSWQVVPTRMAGG